MSNNKIIQKIKRSLSDRKKFSNINFDKKKISNKKENFYNLIVKKPWGHEYLLFSSPEISIWILNITKNHKTSMHCHPNKKTSLILLKGKANLYSIEKKFTLQCGNVVTIEKGAFHRTSSEFDQDLVVMEIETPTNKYDIVRYKDDYNRSSSGYETSASYSKVKKNDQKLTYESINTKPQILGDYKVNIIKSNKIDNLDDRSLITPLKIKKFNRKLTYIKIYSIPAFFVKKMGIIAR